MNKSIDAVLGKVREAGAQALLVNSPPNRRYLTGFSGSAGTVWISEKRRALLTDFRYIEQAKGQCPGWEIIHIDELEKSIAVFSHFDPTRGGIPGNAGAPVHPGAAAYYAEIGYPVD